MIINRKSRGIDFTFDVRQETGFEDNISDMIVIDEILNEDVYQIDPVNGVVVDVGANIGVFSIMCDKLGAKQVYSLEPEPENFAQFEKNIALNNCKNITAINAGLWFEDTVMKMYPGQGASLVEGVVNDKKRLKIEAASTDPIDIKMMSIEKFFNTVDGDIDILKMDVEWAEYKIIKNIPVEHLSRVKYITLEFHSTDEIEFGYMLARLSEVFNIHTIGKFNKGGQIYGHRY